MTRTYFENDISGTLLRERSVGLFDDVNISGLGVRDSFHGGWELGHGYARNGDTSFRTSKVYISG